MFLRARWLRLAATCLMVLLFAAHARAGDAQEAHSVDIASLDDGEFPTLTAVVNVLDPAGKPLVGLGVDGFAASINDTPFPIDSVTTAVNSDIGVAVVLVVDVSGSMAGEPLVQAKTAARGFVEGLSSIDTVALISFSDDVAVLHDFTGDREAVFAAMEGLQAEGNTALYQAATLAAGKAAEATSQRRAIVLLSDGVDFGNMSAVSRDDSLAWVQAIGVPFFTIGLGNAIDREYLSALSQRTDGQFLETPTAEGLSRLYQDIGSFLRSQYVITVNAEGIDETQPLTFRLEVIALGQVLGSAEETLPARRAAPPLLEPPQLSVTGLVSGQEIREPLTLTVEATGARSLSTVTILVDGQTVLRDSLAPFQLVIDPEVFADGNHVIRIEATDSGGATGTTELSFVIVVPAAARTPPPALILVPVALLAGLSLLVALILVRRRRLRPSAPTMEARAEAWSPVRQDRKPVEWTGPRERPPAVEDRPLGKLTVASGPLAGDVFFIGSRPRRIGSAPHCDIVLPEEEREEEDVSSEDARVWISQNRLMFHKLATLGAMAFDGGSGGWVVYESGDEVCIGPHRLIFELLPTEEPQPEPPVESEQAAGTPPNPESHATSGLPPRKPAKS